MKSLEPFTYNWALFELMLKFSNGVKLPLTLPEILDRECQVYKLIKCFKQSKNLLKNIMNYKVVKWTTKCTKLDSSIKVTFGVI